MQNGQNKEFFCYQTLFISSLSSNYIVSGSVCTHQSRPPKQKKAVLSLTNIGHSKTSCSKSSVPKPIIHQFMPSTPNHRSFSFMILAVLNLTLALMQLSNAKWKGCTSNWDNWVSHWMGAMSTLPLPRKWTLNKLRDDASGKLGNIGRKNILHPIEHVDLIKPCLLFAKHGVYLDDDVEVLFWCTRPLTTIGLMMWIDEHVDGSCTTYYVDCILGCMCIVVVCLPGDNQPAGWCVRYCSRDSRWACICLVGAICHDHEEEGYHCLDGEILRPSDYS